MTEWKCGGRWGGSKHELHRYALARELSLSVLFWTNGAVVSALLWMIDKMVDKWFESLLEDQKFDIRVVLVVDWLLLAIMIWLAVNVWQIIGIGGHPCAISDPAHNGPGAASPDSWQRLVGSPS
jgi:hypothetical protein